MNEKYVAVAEGSSSKPHGEAIIYLYNVETKKLMSKLTTHTKGIQSMCFSFDNRYLVTLGTQGDDLLVVWDITSGKVLRSAPVGGNTMNQVKMDPFVDQSHLQFVTVGNNASLTLWRLDNQNVLENIPVPVPDRLQNVHFLSVEFTQLLPAPAGTYYIVMGASDGSIVAYDNQRHEYVDVGTRGEVIEGEVGVLSLKSSSMVIASSQGVISHYPLVGAQIQPVDPDTVTSFTCDAAIVAVSMDDLNYEGLVGTENGTIYYVNFQDSNNVDASMYPIPIVSSNNINRDRISLLKIDPGISQTFVSNCGTRSAQFKINTITNCDLVYNNQNNLEDDGHVVFVISNGKADSSKSARRFVGFSNGVIKRFNFKNLSPADRVWRLPMASGE